MPMHLPYWRTSVSDVYRFIALGTLLSSFIAMAAWKLATVKWLSSGEFPRRTAIFAGLYMRRSCCSVD